jgi:hypothetical protein
MNRPHPTSRFIRRASGLWAPQTLGFAGPPYGICPEACCGPTVTCVECENERAPQYLTVVISGITGSGDTRLCNCVNGTFVLDYDTSCVWTCILEKYCGGGYPSIGYVGFSVLSAEVSKSGSYYYLTVRAGTLPSYACIWRKNLGTSAPNCMSFSDLRISLYQDHAYCDLSGATCKVTSGASGDTSCPTFADRYGVECGDCTDEFFCCEPPDEMLVTVSGLTDYEACSECEDLNGQYVCANVDPCLWRVAVPAQSYGCPCYNPSFRYVSVQIITQNGVTTLVVRICDGITLSHDFSERWIDCDFGEITPTVTANKACNAEYATITVDPLWN